MNDILYFKVFCFEAYKSEKKMTGKETMNIFIKYNVLYYLETCFDVLHTMGRNALIEDIDMFIAAKNVKYDDIFK
ncbi:MAG: DUF3791 domain-containing protein [Erysipelotrichaceae bacterium]|nr:DUF3791 domain-containing protein [Erysipelotrichaceae bacterium]